ncbi:MAG: phage holin family protein [Chitinophagaceae bacterium]|nr:phage holin family protein [Chitinophagaceae bacterium]
MERFFLKILMIALATIAAAYLLRPNVQVADVKTALIVGLVLALLNTFLKPILIILTIPITIITLGLFLIVINILIIKLADNLIDGFSVNGWLYAFLFSLIVSLVTWLLEKFVPTRRRLI